MIWKAVLDKIYNGEKTIPSPFSKGAIIEFYFVGLDEQDRKGFFLAWCPVSLKGIQVTNIKIPSNLTFITMNEFKEKVKVPEVKWMDPTK